MLGWILQGLQKSCARHWYCFTVCINLCLCAWVKSFATQSYQNWCLSPHPGKLWFWWNCIMYWKGFEQFCLNTKYWHSCWSVDLYCWRKLYWPLRGWQNTLASSRWPDTLLARVRGKCLTHKYFFYHSIFQNNLLVAFFLSQFYCLRASPFRSHPQGLVWREALLPAAPPLLWGRASPSPPQTTGLFEKWSSNITKNSSFYFRNEEMRLRSFKGIKFLETTLED